MCSILVLLLFLEPRLVLYTVRHRKYLPNEVTINCVFVIAFSFYFMDAKSLSLWGYYNIFEIFFYFLHFLCFSEFPLPTPIVYFPFPPLCWMLSSNDWWTLTIHSFINWALLSQRWSLLTSRFYGHVRLAPPISIHVSLEPLSFPKEESSVFCLKNIN